MNFNIVIDSSLLALGLGADVIKTDKNRVLSLVNQFEDGKWHHENLHNFIWDNIAETALSFGEREALKLKPRTLLIESAKKLRLSLDGDDIGGGSELAEIVLYGIMKHKFGAIPVVPKIFYKQNTQDNAKGADSVHIIVEGNDKFTLWFGEAKFYSEIENARLPAILDSIAASLNTEKLKKENSIITSLGDLELIPMDTGLRGKIRSALSNQNSIDPLKEIINIPILLMHECPITATALAIDEEYIKRIKEYHTERSAAYFSRQVEKLSHIFKYSSLTFHLILFPVPQKKPVIDSFVKVVSQHRERL